MAMTETHSHPKARSSEETAQLYRQKYETQIQEWNAKVDTLNASSTKLSAQSHPGMEPQIHAVNRSYEATKARLRELADADDDTWDALEGKAERAWLDFKAAIEKAYDALESHAKSLSHHN